MLRDEGSEEPGADDVIESGGGGVGGGEGEGGMHKRSGSEPEVRDGWEGWYGGRHCSAQVR